MYIKVNFHLLMSMGFLGLLILNHILIIHTHIFSWCRIRRAGYPIRHTFKEFVDRYRMLAPGMKPSHMEDCKAGSQKICKLALDNEDWQLGHHKVFLKVRMISKKIPIEFAKVRNSRSFAQTRNPLIWRIVSFVDARSANLCRITRTSNLVTIKYSLAKISTRVYKGYKN